jgi:hypothetical protein
MCGIAGWLGTLPDGENHAERMLLTLRHRGPDAHIYTGDLQDVLNGIDRTFDLSTLWDVFEHLPQPRAVLKALAGKVSANGCIFIETIHESSLVPLLGRLSYGLTCGRVRNLATRTHEAHHLVFVTRKGLGILARDARLEIQDLWFDRLFLSRMDGNRLIALPTSMLLALENALGNGLFVDLILRIPIAAPPESGIAPRSGDGNRANARPSGSSPSV